jgi:type II secretory pathway component PulC
VILREKKNKLTFPLVIITIGIWIMIIYQVISYLHFLGQEKKEIILDKKESLFFSGQKKEQLDETQIYLTIDRDPFVFSKKQSVKKIISAGLNKVEPLKPKFIYEIKGIIINDRSKLVVFVDKINSKTLFLREGEIYEIVKLIKITTDKVILTENGNEKEISLK